MNTQIYLKNAEQQARKYPATFKIPGKAQRSSLAVGDLVKVVFTCDPLPKNGPDSERMWLQVERVKPGGDYVGRLDNKPGFWPWSSGHRVGDMITFGAENVIDIVQSGNERPATKAKKPTKRKRAGIGSRVRSAARAAVAGAKKLAKRATKRKAPARRKKATKSGAARKKRASPKQSAVVRRKASKRTPAPAAALPPAAAPRKARSKKKRTAKKKVAKKAPPTKRVPRKKKSAQVAASRPARQSQIRPKLAPTRDPVLEQQPTMAHGRHAPERAALRVVPPSVVYVGKPYAYAEAKGIGEPARVGDRVRLMRGTSEGGQGISAGFDLDIIEIIDANTVRLLDVDKRTFTVPVDWLTLRGAKVVEPGHPWYVGTMSQERVTSAPEARAERLMRNGYHVTVKYSESAEPGLRDGKRYPSIDAFTGALRRGQRLREPDSRGYHKVGFLIEPNPGDTSGLGTYEGRYDLQHESIEGKADLAQHITTFLRGAIERSKGTLPGNAYHATPEETDDALAWIAFLELATGKRSLPSETKVPRAKATSSKKVREILSRAATAPITLEHKSALPDVVRDSLRAKLRRSLKTVDAFVAAQMDLEVTDRTKGGLEQLFIRASKPRAVGAEGTYFYQGILFDVRVTDHDLLVALGRGPDGFTNVGDSRKLSPHKAMRALRDRVTVELVERRKRRE